jgi:hypothetical protein
MTGAGGTTAGGCSATGGIGGGSLRPVDGPPTVNSNGESAVTINVSSADLVRFMRHVASSSGGSFSLFGGGTNPGGGVQFSQGVA